MKKKLLLLLSAIVFITALMFLSACYTGASADTEGDFKYSVNCGKATVSGLTDESYTGKLDIPSELGGYPVTSISNDAFHGCTGLTSITIPSSVTEIGEVAFAGCTGISAVSIPDSVTKIGMNAFVSTAWYDAQPNGLVYAGKVAYKYKGTCPESVTIKEGALGIANNAFIYCSDLKSITIPNSVKSIGYNAFMDCTSLESIVIPDSVTFIDSHAFYNTAWYNNQFDGLVYAGKIAYKYKGTCPESVTIKDGTSGIANSAFSDCTGLESITIPSSVTSIGDYAFYDCKGLTSITIPDSVTSIGKSAFEGCWELTSITIPSSVTEIGEQAFNFGDNFTIYGAAGSYAEKYAKENRIRFAVKTDEDNSKKSNTLIVIIIIAAVVVTVAAAVVIVLTVIKKKKAQTNTELPQTEAKDQATETIQTQAENAPKIELPVNGSVSPEVCFCRFCGKQIRKNAVFCDVCGKKQEINIDGKNE